MGPTALMAGLPVLALSVLTVGVTFPEILRVMLAVIVTLLTGLSIGVLVSTWSIDSTRALMGAAMMILMLLGVPLLVLGMASPPVSPQVSPFYGFSPIFTFMTSIEQSYVMTRGVPYWRSIVLLLLTSVACVTVSTLALPHRWQDQPKKRTKLKGARSRRPRKIQVMGDPIFWFRRSGIRVGWGTRGFIGLLVVVWVVGIGIAVTNRRVMEAAFITACTAAFLVHLSSKFLTALETIRPVLHERQSGEMELVLATPLPPKAIIAGHMTALRRGLRRLAWLGALLNMAMVASVIVFHDELNMDGGAGAVFSTFFIGGFVALFHDLRVIRWIGFHGAMTRPSHAKALFHTLRPVLLTPWLVFGIGLAIAAASNVREGDLVELAIAWFLFCLVASEWKTWRAKRALRKFRELAAS